MNSYQRYIGMVRGEKVDIVPRIPVLMHFGADYLGVSYADFASRADVMFNVNRKLVADFGFDQLDIMSDPFRETSAYGGKVTYMETTIPKCTRPLKDSKDMSLLKTLNPFTSPRLKATVDCIGMYKEFSDQEHSITGWVEGPAAEAADLRDVEPFLYDLMDDDAFAFDLMDLCVDGAIAYAQAQVNAGCDTIGIGDAIASQISAPMYENQILEHEERLVNAIHEMGALVRLHICGDINHILDGISDLNIDIIDCDWQVDMELARRTLGDKVTLAGNLDPVEDIMRSHPKKIREDFQTIYKKVGNPYFVNAGCEVPVGTPIENLKALCEPIETL